MKTFSKASKYLQGLLILLALANYSGCDFAYPEVVIINKTGEHIMLKDLSFNGCLWNTVIGFEESTSPSRCLPGTDHIHFKKFDASSYCKEQAKDGTIDGVCLCDSDTNSVSDAKDGTVDEGMINSGINWFDYQTISIKEVGYGEFHIYEVTLEDIEQDFSVPGPYGH